MSNHASHASLPYIIKGARFSYLIPFLDSSGTPTDPVTPDTEFSLDDSAPADCAEEVGTLRNSVGLHTATGAETNGSTLSIAAKSASGPKTTLLVGSIKTLASVGTGTLSAGSSGGGTLGTLLAYDVTGCFIKTTGGTGGGGTGGANNQARRIVTYTPSTGAFTVAPNWETTPDNTTTYDVLLPDGVTLGMLKALNPTTPGNTLDVTSTGEAGIDLANVGSPTTTLSLSGLTIKNVTDVAAKTTNLPSDPADASDVAAAFSTVNSTLATIASYIDTEVAAIKAKTDTIPASPASTTNITAASGISLAAGQADAIAAALLDLADALESGLTLRKGLRGIVATLLGKSSGAGTTSVTFRDVADSKDVIVATVDGSGNRTALTRTLT